MEQFSGLKRRGFDMKIVMDWKSLRAPVEIVDVLPVFSIRSVLHDCFRSQVLWDRRKIGL